MIAVSNRAAAGLLAGTVVVIFACAPPSTAGTSQQSGSPSAGSSTSGGTPTAAVPIRQRTPTPSVPVNPRLADIDAAIRAADPDGVVIPVLDCINQIANKSPDLWNSTLGKRDFYVLVQDAARQCGVTVIIVVRPGPIYSFGKQ